MAEHRDVHRAVILTALKVEYQAVRRRLVDPQELVHPQGTVYEVGRFQGDHCTWDVGIVETGAGNSAASFEAERAIQHMRPEVVLFVGVAGGIKDVQLGDVVAATKVYGYESGKDEAAFKPRPSVGIPSYALEQRARAEARNDRWQERITAKSPRRPQAFVGPIAAGEKVVAAKESDTAELIRKAYSDALAVEMESYGFMKAVSANDSLHGLVVRGISDLLDSKAQADASGSQEIAADHASAFAFEVLAHFDPSHGKVPAPQPSTPPSTPAVRPEPPVKDGLTRNQDGSTVAVDEWVFRFTPKGPMDLTLAEMRSAIVPARWRSWIHEIFLPEVLNDLRTVEQVEGTLRFALEERPAANVTEEQRMTFMRDGSMEYTYRNTTTGFSSSTFDVSAALATFADLVFFYSRYLTRVSTAPTAAFTCTLALPSCGGSGIITRGLSVRGLYLTDPRYRGQRLLQGQTEFQGAVTLEQIAVQALRMFNQVLNEFTYEQTTTISRGRVVRGFAELRREEIQPFLTEHCAQQYGKGELNN